VRHSPPILALLAVGALLAAGCAGDGGSGATAADPATTAAPATIAAPATTADDGPATTAGGVGGDYGRGGYGDQPATTGGDAGTSGGVRIAGFAFAPRTLTAKVGQKVTWKNQEPTTTHTVTALDGSFGSGRLQPGDGFSHVFRRAGTFAYHCSIHPAMRGTVKVDG
jgi:plastocyanin